MTVLGNFLGFSSLIYYFLFLGTIRKGSRQSIQFRRDTNFIQNDSVAAFPEGMSLKDRMGNRKEQKDKGVLSTNP